MNIRTIECKQCRKVKTVHCFPVSDLKRAYPTCSECKRALRKRYALKLDRKPGWSFANSAP